MRSNNSLKAKTLALAIAIGVGSPATAVRADELQDLKAQIEALQNQIEALQKKVGEMHMTQPPQPAGSTGADYAKGLPFVADDGSLTFHGITLYGTVDIGVAYQTHGTPLSNSAGSGLEYLISKNSNHSQFSAAPNAMTTSNIGLKGTVETIPGVSAIFNLQTAFLPTSGRLADGLGSIVQNNGVPLGSQTSNADSSRNGQAFNSVAWAGLSSPTYGALTFGRQNALTLDGVLAYDPMGGSSAFSVIGFQGATAGAGATEDARFDNSVKYRVNHDPFRASALYKFGASGSNAYQAGVGVDYLGASFDAIYSHVNDAVTAAPLASVAAITAAQLASAGSGLVAGTVSDNTSIMLLAKYRNGPVQPFAGYEYIQFANPAHPLAVGSQIPNSGGGYSLGTVNNAAFTNKKVLQVFWTGAKYAVRDDIDLIAAYYHEQQNSFQGNGCSNNTFAACSGQLDAVSVVADYRFAKRFDVYAGAMFSKVSNGLSSGFLNTSTIDPTVGLRFTF
jgi:predicted porin